MGCRRASNGRSVHATALDVGVFSHNAHHGPTPTSEFPHVPWPVSAMHGCHTNNRLSGVHGSGSSGVSTHGVVRAVMKSPSPQPPPPPSSPGHMLNNNTDGSHPTPTTRFRLTMKAPRNVPYSRGGVRHLAAYHTAAVGAELPTAPQALLPHHHQLPQTVTTPFQEILSLRTPTTAQN